MCGRYILRKTWVQDLLGYWHLHIERIDTESESDWLDVRPTHRMPIIRMKDGKPIVEQRSWGFLRMMPGVKPGKLVKKQLFNAKSETAMALRSFKAPFAQSRCLIPMTAWYEWPERAGAKQKVEIFPRNGRTLLAAGLYETSKTFDTGEPIETFTMLTTKPTELLGTVHDRAPLVMLPEHYEDWIVGDAAQAQALVDVHPGNDDFDLKDV